MLRKLPTRWLFSGYFFSILMTKPYFLAPIFNVKAKIFGFLDFCAIFPILPGRGQ